MRRRTFLKKSCGSAALFAAVPSALRSGEEKASTLAIETVLKKLCEINDRRITCLLAAQVDKPGERWDGGVVDGYALANAHSTKAFIVALASAYACRFSKYHLSLDLEKPMERAIDCLLNVQHADGTIDLHSTNFHSTPDTAFIVNDLGPVHRVLKRLNRTGLAASITGMEQFIARTGKCLAVGGIHTPNHRWVVCSALARVNSLFPSRQYVDRIDEWLSEGVDQDPDGQFTERSVSIYSPTCDDAFLTMGRLLNRPQLYDVVRKNLDMTLYYIQPGGEVLTDASGRQDSTRSGYVNGYYFAYRYFAVRDNNPVYAAVCQLIEQRMPEKITRFLPPLMEDPVFERPLPGPARIPDNYFKHFAHSGLFRIRRGDIDISVIEGNPTFLVYRRREAVMQSMRLHAAFFGSRGQFISETTSVDGRSITLKRPVTHGYYQPFPEEKRSGHGDWDKMPRAHRRMSEIQTLKYRVTVTERNGKVSVDIEITGTGHVPVSLEMSFRAGGELSGVQPDEHGEDCFFLESGTGRYRAGGGVITFGPGRTDHKWAQMRGMLPKRQGLSVYITGFTPFNHSLELS